MTSETTDRLALGSAWLLYALIVLEILFMVSPFAAYYYAAYATPLNVLQEQPATAWLTMYVLPHFAYSESTLANLLILISWPLIGVGGLLFLIGFCQIYWSKLTSKNTVAIGLYRHIRHPQYLALAIVGLGTTLFWSRFIVGIGYATMLFLYYLLARLEERLCTKKFGDNYTRYVAETGMFLPRRWERRLSKLAVAMPLGGVARVAVAVALYVGSVALVVFSGFAVRGHVIESLTVVEQPQRTVLFLAPFAAAERDRASQLLDELQLEGRVAYVAPTSWQVPELGLHGGAGYQHGGLQELMYPTTHGNSFDFDSSKVSVLLTKANFGGAQQTPHLAQLLGIEPVAIVDLDLSAGKVVTRRSAVPGRWNGIPVPVF